MITTVTLDPRLELAMEAAELAPGRACATRRTGSVIRGGGVHVSIALRALGLPTLCTGISFDGGGQGLLDYLEYNTVSSRFVAAHGELPIDIRLADGEGRCTVLTQQDPPIHPGVVERYLETLGDCGAKSAVVVLSGRVPGGLDDGIYRRSIQALRKLPVKVVVDGAGKPFKEALRQKPYLVKQSARELEATFGVRCEGVPELVRHALTYYINRGVEIACITMGSGGALLVGREAALFAPALPVAAVSARGAGDCLTAGLCKGIREGAGMADMLRYGVAAAAASVLREDPLLCRWDDFCRLLPLVRVEALELPKQAGGEERQPIPGRKQKTR